MEEMLKKLNEESGEDQLKEIKEEDLDRLKF